MVIRSHGCQVEIDIRNRFHSLREETACIKFIYIQIYIHTINMFMTKKNKEVKSFSWRLAVVVSPDAPARPTGNDTFSTSGQMKFYFSTYLSLHFNSKKSDSRDLVSHHVDVHVRLHWRGG